MHWAITKTWGTTAWGTLFVRHLERCIYLLAKPVLNNTEGIAFYEFPPGFTLLPVWAEGKIPPSDSTWRCKLVATVTWCETWGILLNLMQVRIFSKVLLGFAKKNQGILMQNTSFFACLCKFCKLLCKLALILPLWIFKFQLQDFTNWYFLFPNSARVLQWTVFWWYHCTPTVCVLHSDSLREAEPVVLLHSKPLSSRL